MPMSFILKLFVVSILAGINQSCARAEDNKVYFPAENMKKVSFKPVFSDVFIGIPRDFYIIENNLLILDMYEGKHITLIDLKNSSEAKRIANKGQGPNEFLRIGNLSYDSTAGVLHVFDEYARNLSSYNVEERKIVFNDENLKQKVHLSNTTYDVIPFGNNFVANGNFNGKQFVLLDEHGGIKDEFGVYPGKKDAINMGMAYYLMNQNRLIANPQGTHFAAAGFMNDQLVFYKKEGNTVKKIKEYFNYDSEVTPSIQKQGNGQLYGFSENDNTMRAYIDVYATDNYMYALYIGLSKSDLGKGDHPCYILKFDWNGNFIEGFKSNMLILSFAVDESNRKIYAVTRPWGDNESILVECGLP